MEAQQVEKFCDGCSNYVDDSLQYVKKVRYGSHIIVWECTQYGLLAANMDKLRPYACIYKGAKRGSYPNSPPSEEKSTVDKDVTVPSQGINSKPLKETEVSGTKHDENKLMYDIMPWESVEEIQKVLNFGANKYAPRNWEKGILYGRVFSAALRHLLAWWRGEDLDPETGISHLAHAGCCVMFLLAYEKKEMGKHWDDRPASKARKEYLASVAPMPSTKDIRP